MSGETRDWLSGDARWKPVSARLIVSQWITLWVITLRETARFDGIQKIDISTMKFNLIIINHKFTMSSN